MIWTTIQFIGQLVLHSNYSFGTKVYFKTIPSIILNYCYPSIISGLVNPEKEEDEDNYWWVGTSSIECYIYEWL